MKKTIFVIPLMIILVFASMAASPKSSLPGMIDLGTLGGLNSYGYAINNLGQITGNSSFSTTSYGMHAFLWEDGTMHDLGTFGKLDAYPADINDLGQIAADAMDFASSDAILWSEGGYITVAYGSVGTFATASGINKLSQFVGISADDRGFIWRNGIFTDLGAFYPSAINTRGQVCGDIENQAATWENGEITYLGGTGGEWVGSSCVDINKYGVATGTKWKSTVENRAILWINGTLVELGTLGGNRSYASAINDCGQVVGGAQTATGEWHAFLWENGKITDLGTLGGSISGANDINNFGQITGSSSTADGDSHAFLWTGDEIWLKKNINKCSK